MLPDYRRYGAMTEVKQGAASSMATEGFLDWSMGFEYDTGAGTSRLLLHHLYQASG